MLGRVIEEGDFCSLGGVILILVLLGRMYADDKQKKQGAVIALLSFVGYGVASIGPATRSAEALLHMTLRALSVYGLMLGVSWIILPLLAGFVGWFRFPAAAPSADREKSRKQEERQKAEAMKQHLEEEARRAEQHAIARQKAETEAITERERQLEHGRRRSDALAACDILYQIHAEALGNRFPQETYQAWVGRHMTESVPVEQFEARAEELQQLILRQVPEQKPPEPEEGIDAVIESFKLRQSQLQAAGLEPEWEQTLLAQLRDQCISRLTRKLETP